MHSLEITAGYWDPETCIGYSGYIHICEAATLNSSMPVCHTFSSDQTPMPSTLLIVEPGMSPSMFVLLGH